MSPTPFRALAAATASVPPVKPPRAVISTVSALVPAATVPVIRPSAIRATRTAITVAVSAIVGTAATPGVEMEAGAAAIGHVLDQGIATGRANPERGSVRGGCETEASDGHRDQPEGLQAQHHMSSETSGFELIGPRAREDADIGLNPC